MDGLTDAMKSMCVNKVAFINRTQNEQHIKRCNTPVIEFSLVCILMFKNGSSGTIHLVLIVSA
jgi:hypothetical protein